MIGEILEIIKSWHGVAQFLFITVLIMVMGTISIALSSHISDFFNKTLTIWVRGYPPHNENNRKEEDNEDSSN